MDQNVPKAITMGLRLRDVDVITAWEDGCSELPDDQLLDRASELDSVLFTHDDDLLIEAARRQQNGISFVGVIFARQLDLTIGKIVEDLETIAKVEFPEDLYNSVLFLPL
jgi:predicted nuclease of predicted toxin-antitoxin system